MSIFNDNNFTGPIELSNFDFESNGMNMQKLNSSYNGKLTIVKFYSPTCVYCIESQKDYIDLSYRVNDNETCVVAQFDCTKYPEAIDTLNNFLYGYKVEGYPTYIIFVNSLYYKTYSGGRDVNSMLNELYAIKTLNQNTITN
jgi:thiol-disulfide isomerase/thioredoxin